jgi:hypothetical protein
LDASAIASEQLNWSGAVADRTPIGVETQPPLVVRVETPRTIPPSGFQEWRAFLALIALFSCTTASVAASRSFIAHHELGCTHQQHAKLLADAAALVKTGQFDVPSVSLPTA